MVYPTCVENLLFPASMVEGHYQDRSTFARLVVKVGLLRSDGGRWAASPDFERHFKLVAVAVATGGAVSADPYRSTDGHPSIGGHLLFDPPVAE